MKPETVEEKLKRLESENRAMQSALKNANEDAMVIRLIVAAGHIHEDVIEAARALARGI